MIKLKRSLVISFRTDSFSDNSSTDDNSDEDFDEKKFERNIKWSEKSIQLNDNKCHEINKCLNCETIIKTQTFSNDVLLSTKDYKCLKKRSNEEKRSNFVDKSCDQMSHEINGKKNNFDINSDEINNNSNDCDQSLEKIINCKDLTEVENLLLKPVKQIPQENQSFAANEMTFKRGSKKSSIDNKANVNESNNSLKYNANDIQLIELKEEGIQLINGKTGDQLNCLLCEKLFDSIESAIIHSQSDSHSKMKFGDNLMGIDALFTIDSENIGDVQKAIARIIELRKLSNNLKNEYLNHGIRLKDGNGSNAYVCLKCNISFSSLSEVQKHIQVSNKSITRNKSLIKSMQKSLVNKSQSLKNISKASLSDNTNRNENGFRNEGISNGENGFFCYFCNMYFDCEETVISHLNDSRHERIKLGESLNPIDARFVINSDRINEFEVAFARKDLLKKMTQQMKNNLFIEGIRLKDGIGLDAFLCQKCGLSIPSSEDIDLHLKSSRHNSTHY